MSIDNQPLKALKLAPMWKRFLSYCIDMSFLIILMYIMCFLFFEKDLTDIITHAKQYGVNDLIINKNLFPASINEVLSSAPEEIRTNMHILYFFLGQYYYRILIIYHLLCLSYFFLFYWGTGQTLGSSVMKIRVITTKGEKISPLQALIRTVGLKTIEIGYGLPALIFINPILKQLIHDYLSQTVVIENQIWKINSDIKEEDVQELTPELNKTDKD